MIRKVTMLTTSADAAGIDDRRFFTAMAIAVLVATFLGFAPTYYLRPLTRALVQDAGAMRPLPLIVHLHAIGFTAWVVLFVVQVRLVAGNRTNVHRRLGLIAAWLTPILVITGLMTAVRGARDGWNPGGPFPDPLAFMVVSIGDMVVFTALLIPALALRHRPALHKRLMLLATVGGLMPPAVVRIPLFVGQPLPAFVAFAVLVLATAAWDFWCASRYRLLSLAVGMAILATVVLRPLLGATAAWHAFATWVVG